MGRFLLFLLAWTAVSSSKTSEFRSVPEAFEVVEAIEVVIATVMGNSATIDAQTMLLLDGLSKYASRLLSLASTGADTYEGIVDSLSRLRTRYEVRRADLDNAILNAGYAAESHFKFMLFNPPSSSDGNWLSYLGITQDIYTRIKCSIHDSNRYKARPMRSLAASSATDTGGRSQQTLEAGALRRRH